MKSTVNTIFHAHNFKVVTIPQDSIIEKYSSGIEYENKSSCSLRHTQETSITDSRHPLP
jgi:hypothetical protein